MTTLFADIVRGVAFGDAWGDPTEFSRISAITANDPRGPELPEHLRITDDTQMTLFLADALDLSRDDEDFEVKLAIQEAFLDYYKDPDTGSRAPGVTVMGSLGSLSRSGNWTAATNNHSDGSGTVMRTSACALLPEHKWVGVTAFAAAITHGTANAIAAAILDVAILRELLEGYSEPGELVERALTLASNPQAYGLLEVGDWLDDYAIPEGLLSGFQELARLLTLALAELPALQLDPWALDSDPSNLVGVFGEAIRFSGAGWRAHETLVVALLAVDMFPKDPWEGLRRGAITNGDSDTIGAVTGALLGAAWPGFFTHKWLTLGERFEPRYVRWIENEADEYEFEPSAPLEFVAAEIVDAEVVELAPEGGEPIPEDRAKVFSPSFWKGLFSRP